MIVAQMLEIQPYRLIGQAFTTRCESYRAHEKIVLLPSHLCTGYHHRVSSANVNRQAIDS